MKRCKVCDAWFLLSTDPQLSTPSKLGHIKYPSHKGQLFGRNSAPSCSKKNVSAQQGPCGTVNRPPPFVIEAIAPTWRAIPITCQQRTGGGGRLQCFSLYLLWARRTGIRYCRGAASVRRSSTIHTKSFSFNFQWILISVVLFDFTWPHILTFLWWKMGISHKMLLLFHFLINFNVNGLVWLVWALFTILPFGILKFRFFGKLK